MSTLISSEKPQKETPNSYSASIIGKPIRIGNLEVAQNDFPKTMRWNDAVKACTDLGNGWRLPTIDELVFLHKNKDEIGGFLSFHFWSNDESEISGYALEMHFYGWGQKIQCNKDDTNHVRAVRSL